MQADAAVRTSPEDIKRFYVSSNKGEMMPLSSFRHRAAVHRSRVHGSLQPLSLRRDPGMLAATLLGIFFIPASFVLVERLGAKRGKHAPVPDAAAHGPAAPH